VITDEGILFQGNGWNSAVGIWRLLVTDQQLEQCLGLGQKENRMTADISARTKTKSLWKMPPDMMIANAAAFSRESQLWLLSAHSKSADIVNEQEHLIIGKKILPQDGYQAELYCFLKGTLAANNVSEVHRRRRSGSRGRRYTTTWYSRQPGHLAVYRRRQSVHRPELSGPAGRYQTRAGIWMVSTGPFDAEITVRKKYRMSRCTSWRRRQTGR